VDIDNIQEIEPGGRSEVEISQSKSIIQLLSKINPEKLPFWKGCDTNSLTIDSRNFFWPLKIPDNLPGEIFPDLEDALKVFLGFFKEINVITNSKALRSSERVGFFRDLKPGRGTTLQLSLIEAKKLYDCLNKSKFTDDSYCAVKIKNDDYITVNFPRGIALDEFITLVENKLDVKLANLLPFDPVTGKIHGPKIKLNSRLSLIFFGKDCGTFDYPFPYRKLRGSESIRLMNVSDSAYYETPCCNCLSCVTVCPSMIAPNILYHLLIHDEIDEIDSYNINSCIRCGRCAIVCP